MGGSGYGHIPVAHLGAYHPFGATVLATCGLPGWCSPPGAIVGARSILMPGLGPCGIGKAARFPMGGYQLSKAAMRGKAVVAGSFSVCRGRRLSAGLRR